MFNAHLNISRKLSIGEGQCLASYPGRPGYEARQCWATQSAALATVAETAQV